MRNDEITFLWKVWVMIALLGILAMFTFFIRVFFYESSEGDDRTTIYIGLLRSIYSPKYFFRIEYNKDDNIETKEYKKKANAALYVFYILFILILIATFTVKR